MRREPYEVEVGRVVLSACELLQREMDEVLQDLIHRAGTDIRSRWRQPAERANRIVLLCARLQTEIHRYAAVRWQQEQQQWKGEQDTDHELFDDHAIDF